MSITGPGGGPRTPDTKSKEGRPATLDIISVDGRWGQVIDSHYQVAASFSNMIVWLDGRSPASGFIDLQQYNLDQKLNVTVGEIRKEFNEEELRNVYWGKPEQDLNPSLKLQVRVFGKYTKKA